MIQILLAATRIAAGGLQMAVGKAANPHLGPGWRNRETFDARNVAAVAQAFAVAVDVDETLAIHLPGEAGLFVENVAKLSNAGQLFGWELNNGRGAH